MKLLECYCFFKLQFLEKRSCYWSLVWPEFHDYGVWINWLLPDFGKFCFRNAKNCGINGFHCILQMK